MGADASRQRFSVLLLLSGQQFLDQRQRHKSQSAGRYQRINLSSGFGQTEFILINEILQQQFQTGEPLFRKKRQPVSFFRRVTLWKEK